MSSIQQQHQQQETAASSKSRQSCDCDILLWRNPIESGKLFGGLLVSLLVLKKVNLITFFLRAAYTILLTTGSIEFISKLFLGQGLITKYGIKECPNTVGFLKPKIDEILKQLPVKQAKMRKLVFAYSPKNTFKAAIVLFLLHKLFSWFSVWTLLFVGVISAFTLPITYKIYQKEIDTILTQLCQLLKQKSNELSKVACEKSKPCLEKLEKKCAPLCNLIRNKLPASTSTTSSITPMSTTAKLASEVPIEKDIPSATTTTATGTTSSSEFPTAPRNEPSSSLGTSTKEFDVDQLTNELKESTQTLKQELEENSNKF
ncbi:Rtn1p NDAI_0C05020 [Naumovozyma dairenensis CBS 421]|uniref:Reticulon-like protein n=1 Tax=Naumovozyma dairenensis (strain ATCC 10597 / BCRC 20456 / CBS 421 / NBRC 0211 / NRRL Y-12639) TaxID=1071378 RepID=G0W8Q0_NAUDC|nr:hypothetical protein NDAI_0C05020 [Naumovozyma dairenensis CBS 421]CCD24161.1 hypothetical protein NDAI_0C05020 [Naumovozyma dairenensis CBS 421]